MSADSQPQTPEAAAAPARPEGLWRRYRATALASALVAESRRAADTLVRTIDPCVAVPELFRALGSESAARRAVAIDCLRRITGVRHGYSPAAPIAERRAAIARWQGWWKASKYRY